MTLIGLNSNVFTPVATGDAPAVTPTSADVGGTSGNSNLVVGSKTYTPTAPNTVDPTASSNVTGSSDPAIKQEAEKKADELINQLKKECIKSLNEQIQFRLNYYNQESKEKYESHFKNDKDSFSVTSAVSGAAGIYGANYENIGNATCSGNLNITFYKDRTYTYTPVKTDNLTLVCDREKVINAYIQAMQNNEQEPFIY